MCVLYWSSTLIIWIHIFNGFVLFMVITFQVMFSTHTFTVLSSMLSLSVYSSHIWSKPRLLGPGRIGWSCYSVTGQIKEFVPGGKRKSTPNVKTHVLLSVYSLFFFFVTHCIIAPLFLISKYFSLCVLKMRSAENDGLHDCFVNLNNTPSLNFGQL